jgi:hypothetical protein
MQFDHLKRRAFIPPRGGAAAPSRPTALAAGAEASGLDRRGLLQSLLAAALAAGPDWRHIAVAATLPLERHRFVELSQKLCAMSIDDEALAGVIQRALADRYSNDDLRRIAELVISATPHDIDRLVAGSGLHDLAKSIVTAWYSGLLGTGEGARVLAYEDALAWRATGYAKAPGTCGEFGDWISRPVTTPDRERRP